MKSVSKIHILVLFLTLALAFGGGVKYGQHLHSQPLNLEEGLLTLATAADAPSGNIYVDIKGAVKLPGVYEFPMGSRIYHALEEAKPLEEAYLLGINQADFLKDGQEIIVYYSPSEENSGNQHTPVIVDLYSPKPVGESPDQSQIGAKININTASIKELETLPGIGESKAGAIINYRRDNGNFSKIEDIKKVSGIGDATYDKIKGMISVD